MEPGTDGHRATKADLRGLLWSLGLLVLTFACVLAASRRGPKPGGHGLVVLATWSSNGEQLVTFRPVPPTAEITFADLVSVADEGRTQPPTFRAAGGYLLPVPTGRETNSAVRFVALAKPGASISGRPVAYTPGSYTVAYTPRTNANRVRAGVALERDGLEDFARRVQNCWEQKTWRWMRFKTYQAPVYVTSPPITNAAAGTR